MKDKHNVTGEFSTKGRIFPYMPKWIYIISIVLVEKKYTKMIVTRHDYINGWRTTYVSNAHDLSVPSTHLV